MSLGYFIAAQREKLGNISQVELAKKCGIPAGTIASIESGYAKSPRSVTLKKLAEGLTVPFEVIFELASNPEKTIAFDKMEVDIYRIPYIGNIPMSDKIKAINTDVKIAFPKEFISDGDYIATINGDSLENEDIYDGDYLVIAKQENIRRSGDLMLCLINGVITLKRVYKHENTYKVDNEVYKKDELKFFGKAILSINKRSL